MDPLEPGLAPVATVLPLSWNVSVDAGSDALLRLNLENPVTTAVSAVRECWAIVAALIGGFVLRESSPASRIAAAVVVTAGIGLLQSASYV